MFKAMTKMSLAVLVVGLLASGAFAGPVPLHANQMDLVTAGGVDTVSGFICTVNLHGDGLLNAADNRSETAAEHVGIGTPSGYDVEGNYVEYVTVAPSGAGDLSVPANATNTGTPTDGFSTPGQPTYSAIWARQ